MSLGRPLGMPSVLACRSEAPTSRRSCSLASRPTKGLLADTCSPVARVSLVRLLNAWPGKCQHPPGAQFPSVYARRSPSTDRGSSASDEKAPALNMYSEATASPSDRLYVCSDPGSVKDQTSPAPASRRTDTQNRSTRSRVFAMSPLTSASSDEMRSIPPTLKCCHLPCGGISWNRSGPKSRCTPVSKSFLLLLS